MTVCERGKKQGLYFHVELVLHFDLQQPALLRGMLREGCQSPMTAHTFYSRSQTPATCAGGQASERGKSCSRRKP